MTRGIHCHHPSPPLALAVTMTVAVTIVTTKTQLAIFRVGYNKRESKISLIESDDITDRFFVGIFCEYLL